MNLSKSDIASIKSILGRDASEVELHIFDTMWSEHCSYKSTKSILKKYLPTKGSEVALGIGEDSGIIRFTKHNGKQYCIAISHESHNHPSQILPIEGSATGVGGVVRDVYCMGADVVGVLNSLHFGINSTGKHSIVDEIAEKVVEGVSAYANPLGVPVLGGETLYHESYNDNCLVNVAAVGLLVEDDIIHSFVPEEAKTEAFDIILIGKSTDATGFGGASFSSVTLDTDDQSQNIGAVQVHDPFLKRVLVEAMKVLFQRLKEKNVPVGFKDLGAGGISCATSEIASHSGYGVVVDLDTVNVAIPNLSPEIIACSETQERFCLAVPKWFSAEVLKIFNEDFAIPKLYKNAGASVIGYVTQTPEYVIKYKGETVCQLPISAITTDVEANRKPEPRDIHKTGQDTLPNLNDEEITSILTQSISSDAIRSKRYVYRFFDNAVRGDTVVYPGEGDSVIVTPIEGCDAGLTVSMDSNLYGKIDPYVAGAAAVAEGIRNVVSVGGRPLAVTDCLNYGNPEKGPAFFEFEEGVKGIADACNALGFIDGEAVPIISGNVSLYNESKAGSAVTPSPVICVVARVDNYKKHARMQLTKNNFSIVRLGARYAQFGGTAIARELKLDAKIAPQVDFKEEARMNRFVYTQINNATLPFCHDISAGGAWGSLIEMVLGERGQACLGLKLTLPEGHDLMTELFSENGGYIVALPTANLPNFETALDDADISFAVLGETVNSSSIEIHQGNRVFTLKTDHLSDAFLSHVD